jgi:hypothetical protein
MDMTTTTNTTAPLPFPDTSAAIGVTAGLELVGTRRGTAVVVGTIVAVDAAPDGARMTTATLRDDDGVDHLVRLPRDMVPAAR